VLPSLFSRPSLTLTPCAMWSEVSNFPQPSSSPTKMPGHPYCVITLLLSKQEKIANIQIIGILNLIFFLRFFPTVAPRTRDVLGLDLAYVPVAEIETLIEQRVTTLVRDLEAERSQPHHANHHPQHPSLGAGNGSGRGQVTVQFFEKRRRKNWYTMRGEDEVCWENWVVKVTVADPKTEGGEHDPGVVSPLRPGPAGSGR